MAKKKFQEIELFSKKDKLTGTALTTYFIHWFVLLWTDRLPWYFILAAVVLCTPALVALWHPRYEVPMSCRLMSTLVWVGKMVVLWGGGERWGVLVNLMLLPLAVIFSVYMFAKQKHYGVGFIFCVLEATVLFFRLLFSTDRYSFLSGGLPFWQVTLAVTLPVVAVVMWLWLWRLVKTVGARLGSALLFVLLIGMVVWAYVVHLNYVLDTNPPKVHTLKIENKKVDNNRKSADDYEFKFTINGQALWHEVSWEEYHAYEIGDVYNLAENQGAFGVPYFTTDDK